MPHSRRSYAVAIQLRQSVELGKLIDFIGAGCGSRTRDLLITNKNVYHNDARLERYEATTASAVQNEFGMNTPTITFSSRREIQRDAELCAIIQSLRFRWRGSLNRKGRAGGAALGASVPDRS